MKIAIIGAGAAGLCAGRHCLEENFSVEIFEQTGNVGGTWNYTDRTGYDEHGVPVHSSMYKGLRTNLPKELMTFEDFPHVQQRQSYLPQEQVLEYLENYSRNFNLDAYIKFHKQVLHVEPHGSAWMVQTQDVKTKQEETGYFNAVLVCNGHYKDTFTPAIPGIETFRGGVKHSHDYRTPDPYKDKTVLILGAGPSGLDISQQIVTVARKVYLSHKSETLLPLPECLLQKPTLRSLDEDGAMFTDGTREKIDDILFCTGYNYSFPFLSDLCGVKVTDHYVHPLYKQVISTENPTLAFIGLPFAVCPFPLFDVQVRFFLSSLNDKFKLPSKEDMLRELYEELATKADIPQRKYHQLGELQEVYFNDLAETAQIKKIPPVIHGLFLRVRMNRNLEHCFRVIDENSWEHI